MTPNRSSDYFSLRLAAFYTTLGVTTGIGMPFFPVWLEFKGFDPAEIGIILAVPMVVRIFFVPLTTRLADRFNMLRGAILIASIGSFIGNAAIGLSNTFWTLMIVISISAIFFTPTFPLADAYALRGLSERGKAYGPVRLWSSAAFITANLIGGLVIGVMPKAGIIWLITAPFIVGTALAWILIPVSIHSPERQSAAEPQKSLWRMPVFVAIVLACGAIQSSHALYYGFSTIAWAAKGLSNPVIGGLWAIGVIAEIALFAVSGRITAVLSPVSLVIVGALGAIVRWTAMAFDPPFALLPVLQVLHALSFGATHIGAMQFLAQVAPAGRGATAQGDLAAVQGMIFSVAMGLSGWMFGAFGDFAYMAMTLLSVLGLTGALIVKFFMQAPQHLNRS
jgi:PPP family 3-phenylpropionic acid transporter